jgi:hypothetical protein
MAVYDLSRAATYLLPETKIESSGTDKFLSENLSTENLNGVKLVGTVSAGNDVLVTQAVLLQELTKKILKPFLITLIGTTRDNFNNQNKDDLSFRDGYFEYLLMDGRRLLLSDYPELGRVLGFTTDFNLPNSLGRFEKNSIKGGANLGTTGEDTIKSFTLTSNQVQPTAQPHSHEYPDDGIYGPKGGGYGGGDIAGTTRWKWVNETTIVINPFTVTSNYSGGAETQPKHIFKQKYIIAKVLI